MVMMIMKGHGWRAVAIAMALCMSVLWRNDVDAQCARLNVPPANVGHVLVSLDRFDGLAQRAQTLCGQHQVASYKCADVHNQLYATLEDMAVVGATEALVNVSLDHSLRFEVTGNDQANRSLLGMLEVMPEQPFNETISAFCRDKALATETCARLLDSIRQEASHEWGCALEASDIPFVELSVGIDNRFETLQVTHEHDVVVEVTRHCRAWRVKAADCFQLVRAVEQQAATKFADTARMYKERLRFTSPVRSRLYPRSERVYVEVDWIDDAAGSREDVCLFADDGGAIYCGALPLPEPVFFVAHTPALGAHMVYVTSRPSNTTSNDGGDVLAAVHFEIVEPTVELLQINTAVHDGNKTFLNLQIQTQGFRLEDPAHRVCILHGSAYVCLNSPNLLVEQRVLNAETNQPVTVFRAPVFNVNSGAHEISVLLLNEHNKCFALAGTYAVDLELGPDMEVLATDDSFIAHPVGRSPRRPAQCPSALETAQLGWICQLYEHEWGLFSQNGEDGVLQAIFNHIGVQHQFYVEFGTETCRECNSRFWRERFGWTGLLLDGSFANATINLHQAWITAENINDLFAHHNVPKAFDLLSVDVDFNDYWILQAIQLERFQPRVIVVEYNSHVPPTEPRTVAYQPQSGWDGNSDYFGAGVAAFYRWGIRAGYSLVYCESHGVNCFFVRNDDLKGVNVSALLGPEQLYAPPNFFGRGYNYSNLAVTDGNWVWV